VLRPTCPSAVVADRGIVRGAALDGEVEDGRVRGQPGHRQLGNVPLERAGLQQVARNVVEPETLSEFVERGGRFIALPPFARREAGIRRSLAARAIHVVSSHRPRSPDGGIARGRSVLLQRIDVIPQPQRLQDVRRRVLPRQDWWHAPQSCVRVFCPSAGGRAVVVHSPFSDRCTSPSASYRSLVTRRSIACAPTGLAIHRVSCGAFFNAKDVAWCEQARRHTRHVPPSRLPTHRVDAVTKVFGKRCRFVRTVSSAARWRCASSVDSAPSAPRRTGCALRADIGGFGGPDYNAHPLLPKRSAAAPRTGRCGRGSGVAGSRWTRQQRASGRFTNSTSFKMMAGRVATTSRATCSACCRSRMSGETGAVATCH